MSLQKHIRETIKGCLFESKIDLFFESVPNALDSVCVCSSEFMCNGGGEGGCPLPITPTHHDLGDDNT